MVRRILIFCIFMLFCTTIFSQQVIKIWGKHPVSRKMHRSKLTVFKAKENMSGISVIICPGGSYQLLAKKKEGYKVAQWLNENGITAFVLSYRVGLFGNHHPAMIQDLQRTIQLIKENADDYNINPDKVGVMGFSAGGHLVGTAGTYFDTNFMESLGIVPQTSIRPAFIAMIYPVITMTNDSIVHKRSRRKLLSTQFKQLPELAQMMSLEQNVRSDMPPVFLIHCKDDKTVNYYNSLYYNAALAEKNVPHCFKLYDKSGHGFGIKPDQRHNIIEAALWTQLFIPWIEDIMNVQLK